jgi:inositol transport system substrate-binding protein
VQPVDGTATGQMSKAAVAAKKPLVYLNRQPSEVPTGTVFVGSRSIDSGIFEMEELGRIMGGKGNIAILMGELSNEATHSRVDGVKKVIKEKYPGIKVIREQTGNWRREEGRTIMENWLASGDQIDGVAANNDEMAIGALMAVKAAGKLDKIPVAGIDAEPDALDSMDKGEMACSVFQDGFGQGSDAAEAAYLAAKNQPNPKLKDRFVIVPYQKVTKANYKSFMKK